MARLKLMYDFYEVMNSIYKHDKPSREPRKYVMKIMEKTDTDMGLCFIPSEHDSTKKYNTEKDWLTIIILPKKAPYLNPNERKVNEKINQMYVLIDSTNI